VPGPRALLRQCGPGHACGRHELEPHFEGRSAKVRAIYEGFLTMVEGFGPVTILPEKTRIAFQVRMSFAQLTIRRDRVVGHLVPARRAEHLLFTRIETFSSSNHLHAFRLDTPGQAASLIDHAREAYAVGRREHLR
jgi:hypothetical protein